MLIWNNNNKKETEKNSRSKSLIFLGEDIKRFQSIYGGVMYAVNKQSVNRFNYQVLLRWLADTNKDTFVPFFIRFV